MHSDCCTEACPQFNERSDSDFIGPAAIGHVHLFNAHPAGKLNAEERLHALMGRGGIAECGNAQNCVEVCPKNIPLTDASGRVGRQATIQMFRDLLG